MINLLFKILFPGMQFAFIILSISFEIIPEYKESPEFLQFVVCKQNLKEYNNISKVFVLKS